MNSNTPAASPNPQVAPSPPIGKRLLSFPALMAALLAGGMTVPLRSFSLDPDVWWHIKVGVTLLSTHRWPTTDPYSFTARGTPWIAYEWVGDVLLAVVEKAWGLRGLMALDFVLAAAVLLALYDFVTLRCGNSKAGFVACALLSPLAYPSFSLRPQMLGYLFLVFTLIILERFRRGRTGTLWLLPLLFVVWVNTHGSFVLGLLALEAYWAGSLVHIHWGDLDSHVWSSGERVRLEAVALLTLVALTITPYGTEVCLYPLNMAFAQPINVSNIQEWQSMMFGMFFGKLFLALILSFILAQVTLRPSWRPEELVLLFAGVTGACLHVRFIAVFVPFYAPLLAVILARFIPPYDPAIDKYALNAGIIAAIVAAVVWFFPSQARLETIAKEKWPVRAVDYIKQHPVPRPMFNTYGYGGFLIWELDGQNKVFVDGRADVYERAGVLADYLMISRLGLAAPFLLDAYGIQSCLIDHDEALGTLLGALGWQKVYGDQLSALYVRRPRAVESGDCRNDARAGVSNQPGRARGPSQ